MKAIKILYFVLAVICISLSSFKDNSIDDLITSLKKKFDDYQQNHIQEKVYVQLDKTFYKPGEDIWFSAFLLEANSHKPSSISDVVYVDLTDPKGNKISSANLFAQNGQTRGDFHLDNSIPGGIYTLTAYTQWMKNDGEESFFRKKIHVQKVITPRLLLKLDFEKEAYGRGDEVSATLTASNLRHEGLKMATVEATVRIRGENFMTKRYLTSNEGKLYLKFQLPNDLATTDGILQLVISAQGQTESITRSVPIILNNIGLRFFPEGGDMIEGSECNVAFKATNEFGKGADVSGVIVNSAGQVVSSFSSFHMGMGSFRFTPVKGEVYKAKIEKPQGNSELTLLPLALEKGYALQMQNGNHGKVECSITSTSNEEVFMIGQSNGKVLYAEKLNLKLGKNSFRISTNDFPQGIAIFTLFNSQGLEEAERLLFLNPEKRVKIEITTDKNVYKPREHVQVTIKTTDYDGKPTPAKLSLSIVDDQLLSFADDKQDNILSWLFLSSELKGEIQEPSFYFDPSETKAGAAIDHLLLTHGWRRFNWKDVVENSKAFAWLPENNSTISGFTLNNENQKTTADVVLIEIGKRRRIAKVRSLENGLFTFRNVDASSPVLLLTRKPNTLQIPGKISPVTKTSNGYATVPDTDDKVSYVLETPTPQPVPSTSVAINKSEGEMDLMLDEDVSSLSEVVVIGYGVENKSDVTGSVTTIRSNDIENIQAYASLENMLQGRISGLQVQRQNVNPGSSNSVIIRGSSSLRSGGNEPLYVIDGIPLAGNLNTNFPTGSIVSPDNVVSIQILKSPEASSIFGSAAANGVILITTRSGIGYDSFDSKRRAPKFSSLIVSPKRFSVSREFYADGPKRSDQDERKDFRSTVYWNSNITTNEKGEATFKFYNNDATSSFRITAEGITGNGLVGREEKVFSTQLPFSIDTKIPPYLGFEDTLRLPVTIKNTQHKALEGRLTVKLPRELKAQGATTLNVAVNTDESATYWFDLLPDDAEGYFELTVSLESKHYSDELKQKIKIHPIGFPRTFSFSGKDSESNIQFEIGDVEKGSLKGGVTVFTNIMDDLFSGAEAILEQPYGCFEQVSSSTFPNILALQFMKESGQLNNNIEHRAMAYIREGYKRLAAYEINGGGFEWFGHPPAHEGLSAFGLVEFHEMKKVFNGVDEAMVKRAQDWLLSRRRGDGTFAQHRGKYGFSAASEKVNNAYLVYALTETGVTSIEKEYQHSLAEAWQSKDTYRMALMANAAISLGHAEDYDKLVNYLKSQIKDVGLANLRSEQSIVCSYGNSLAIETISFWCSALLKSSQRDIAMVDECVRFITSKRSYGMFGSTQATTMALKVLTEYASVLSTARGDGEVLVAVNNSVINKQGFTKDTRRKIEFNDIDRALSNGKNNVRVSYDKSALPYSLNVSWNTKTPAANENCKVRISTTLKTKTMKVNETVRLTATLKNINNDGVPMTVALVGIPAGLSLQPWQLKELSEKGVFDFYEILGDKLAVYYRELGPKEERTIDLDLKADVPGNFTGAASCAYLYYTDEYKDWVKGSNVHIQHN